MGRQVPIGEPRVGAAQAVLRFDAALFAAQREAALDQRHGKLQFRLHLHGQADRRCDRLGEPRRDLAQGGREPDAPARLFEVSQGQRFFRAQERRFRTTRVACGDAAQEKPELLRRVQPTAFAVRGWMHAHDPTDAFFACRRGHGQPHAQFQHRRRAGVLRRIDQRRLQLLADQHAQRHGLADEHERGGRLPRDFFLQISQAELVVLAGALAAAEQLRRNGKARLRVSPFGSRPQLNVFQSHPWQ